MSKRNEKPANGKKSDEAPEKLRPSERPRHEDIETILQHSLDDSGITYRGDDGKASGK